MIFTVQKLDWVLNLMGVYVVPTADKKYLAETIRLIKYYNSNPSAYEELSYKVREEVLKYDWKHVIYDWLDFFENPSTDLNPTI